MSINNNNVNNIDNEIPIPEFQDLKEILGCENCEKDCSCNPSRRTYPDIPHSSWSCIKTKKKARIIEIILGIVLESLIISISYLIFRNFVLTLILAILIIAVMFYFDFTHWENIVRKMYVSKENERKQKHDKQVKDIEKQNELIMKQAKGETEEYFSFKNKISKVTAKLETRKEKIFSESGDNSQDNSSTKRAKAVKVFKKNLFAEVENDSESETKLDGITEKFAELLTNLKELNDQIMPANFEYTYIQTFYNSHLPSLIDNIDTYYNKKTAEELTIKEEEAFEKLVESFKNKIKQIMQGLKEQDQKDFMKKLSELQKEINTIESDNEEE